MVISLTSLWTQYRSFARPQTRQATPLSSLWLYTIFIVVTKVLSQSTYYGTLHITAALTQNRHWMWASTSPPRPEVEKTMHSPCTAQNAGPGEIPRELGLQRTLRWTWDANLWRFEMQSCYVTLYHGPIVVRSVTEILFHVFHLMTHHEVGWIFTENYILWPPAAFQHNWSAGYNPNRDPWPFERKINRLWQTVEDYFCVQIQVILIGFFYFNRANIPTHTNTLWQSDGYIRAAIRRRRG